MPWTFAAVVALLAAAAAALFLRSRRLPPTKRGMKQWARSPAMRRRMSSALLQREDLIARAGDLTEDEIRHGLGQVLAGDRNAAGTWMQLCERLGPRAAPLILDALDDPRAAPPQAKPELGAAHPFKALADMLARTGAEAATPRLQPHLSNPNEHIRRHAIFCIAMSGSVAAADLTAAALADADLELRNLAMIGAGRAAGSGHVSAPFRSAVAAILEPIVAGETSFNEFEDMKAAGALVAVDPEAGLRHLASERCLRLDNPHLASALEELNRAGIRLSASLISPLLEASQQAGHPAKRARGAALAALARAEPAAAAGLVERDLDSDDAAARSGAVDSLLAMHGLPDPYKLWGAENGPGGFDALPRPVQHIIATVEFEAEVNNGGLSQYFLNSGGDHWPIALEAFRAMHCPLCEEILRSATAVIPRGPSLNREKRIRQYGRLSDDQEKPLDDLSSRFYEDDHRLDVRRARYMVEHAGLIRKLAAAIEPRA